MTSNSMFIGYAHITDPAKRRQRIRFLLRLAKIRKEARYAEWLRKNPDEAPPRRKIDLFGRECVWKRGHWQPIGTRD